MLDHYLGNHLKNRMMMTWSYLSTCEDKPLELRVVLRFLLRVRHPRSRRLTAWQKKPLVSQLADLHSWRSRRERWHQISPNHLCVWFLDSTRNESWAGTLHISTFLFPQDQRMARQSTSARMVFDWSDHNGLFPSVCVQPLCEPTALFGVDP